MKPLTLIRKILNLTVPSVYKPVMIIIPARLDSTRLPRKVIKPICGIPMVGQVYNRCLSAGFEEHEVIIAVDSLELQGILRSNGFNTILTSNTHISGTDRVLEAAQLLNLDDDTTIINIQGDEPEIDPLLIKQLVHHTHRGIHDIVTLKAPLTDVIDKYNMDTVKVVTDNNNKAMYFSRSDIPYTRNIEHTPERFKHVGVYGYKLRALKRFGSLTPTVYELSEGLEQLRALENGMSILAVEACTTTHNGVDSLEDYERVTQRMEKVYEYYSS
jgi:3-deoxy-manno-octulosonate cytidylyltransferase (CMP-KDO synthetase)